MGDENNQAGAGGNATTGAEAAKAAAAAAAAAKNDDAKAAPPSIPSSPSPSDRSNWSAQAAYYAMLQAIAESTLNSQDKQRALNSLKSANPTSDRLTYRWAICIIGAIATVAIVVAALLAHSNADASAVSSLLTVASAAVGGLAALLSTGKSADGPH